MKLAFGNPHWLELRFDCGQCWRSLKERLIAPRARARPGDAATSPTQRRSRKRVFFDWP
jgi:hypothetical protein